jgi:hypothetical protein
MPRGNQLKPVSVRNEEIATAANIALSKLENGTLIALKTATGTLEVATAVQNAEAVNKAQLESYVSTFVGGAVTSALSYKGQYDASTNTLPTPTTVGNAGDYYRISAAGTLSINGTQTAVAINDSIIYNGTNWDKIDNTEEYIAGDGLNLGGTSGFEFSAKTDGTTVTVDGTTKAIKVVDKGVKLAQVDTTTFVDGAQGLTTDAGGLLTTKVASGLQIDGSGNIAVLVDPSSSTALTSSSAGIKLVLPVDVVTNSKIVTREPANGTIDGTNVTFTLAYPIVTGSECVYLNGLLMDEGTGNDYTISGQVITFEYAPEADDKLRVNYIAA